jgi:hypothetical protein
VLDEQRSNFPFKKLQVLGGILRRCTLRAQCPRAEQHRQECT